jgi:hypothetical protein
MRVNRGSTSGPAEVTDGSGMSASAGGGAQRGGADKLRSRTDRGNQNDEDVGSSASRGGAGGEANPVGTGGPVDPDALSDAADRLGPPGSSSNPDVTGTKDALEE